MRDKTIKYCHTTLYLPAELKQAIKALSATTGVSMQKIVTDKLAELFPELAPCSKQQPPAPSAG